MTHLLNSGKLTSLINAIGARSASTAASIQYAAVQCIGHSVVSGDIMHGVRLLEATSKHFKAPLVAFLERNGNFAYDKKAKALTFKRVYASESFTDEKCAELVKGKSWEKHSKPANVISMYDVEVQFEKFITAMNNAAERGATMVNDDLLAVLVDAKAKRAGRIADEQLQSAE